MGSYIALTLSWCIALRDSNPWSSIFGLVCLNRKTGLGLIDTSHYEFALVWVELEIWSGRWWSRLAKARDTWFRTGFEFFLIREGYKAMILACHNARSSWENKILSEHLRCKLLAQNRIKICLKFSPSCDETEFISTNHAPHSPIPSLHTLHLSLPSIIVGW